MTDLVKSPAVRIMIDGGGQILGVTSFSLRDTFTDPLGDLEFNVEPPADYVREAIQTVKKGEIVVVEIDGIQQARMLIQSTTTTVGQSGVSITAHAQSLMCQPYEASAYPYYSFVTKTAVPLSKIVLDNLQLFGLFPYSIEDEVADISFRAGKQVGGTRKDIEALKVSDAHVHPGETVYQFLARICTRYGVVLRCGAKGELLLTAPHYDSGTIGALGQSTISKLKLNRFVGDITVEDTNQGQHSFAKVWGGSIQKSGRTLNAKPYALVSASQVNSSHPAYSSSVAGYKPLYIVDKNSHDSTRTRATAILALGLKASSAFTISGEVAGFQMLSGAYWAVDTMVDLFIEKLGFDEPMWVLERTFKLDRNSGATTSLKLIPKNALLIGELPS